MADEPRQGRRGPTILLRKIVTPIAARAAAHAVPDPARPPPDQASCLEFEEAKMSIEQQIEELRAELRACDEESEIAMIRAELATALAQKAALEIALEAAFQTEN